jgi:hypothetical protein
MARLALETTGLTRTMRRSLRQVEQRHTELVRFAARIANMTDEREMDGGGTSEDYVATLNSLIHEARRLTGIDPQHPKVYCPICAEGVGCDCE